MRARLVGVALLLLGGTCDASRVEMFPLSDTASLDGLAWIGVTLHHPGHHWVSVGLTAWAHPDPCWEVVGSWSPPSQPERGVAYTSGRVTTRPDGSRYFAFYRTSMAPLVPAPLDALSTMGGIVVRPLCADAEPYTLDPYGVWWWETDWTAPSDGVCTWPHSWYPTDHHVSDTACDPATVEAHWSIFGHPTATLAP